ncbi:MAG: T9SS type A sorting domain-containing protein [Ignavibacteria bacterium]|nr:T9SS type A sorting domain-containing protein [Ignavibacteria bacterium]
MPDMGAYESQFPSGINATNPTIPTNYVLYQNYPNPFNPNTKIKFTIPPNVILSEGKNLVILRVYDLLGNEIATIVNENLSAGEYEIEFNGNGMSSGIYIYQLKSGSFIQTKKMILLK